MDAPRRPRTRKVLAFFASWLFLFSAVAFPQSSAGESQTGRIEELFRQERWREIVEIQPSLDISPEVNFEYGIALARLGRLDEAESAFRSGLALRPHDSRFMVELAGVAFQQQKYPRAQDWIQRALKISPDDNYNLEFLATVFYLEGNLEAALKYWNRIKKPHIESVVAQPKPRLDPVLFDRTFTFSPASTLQLSDLLTTQARLDELKLFSTYSFELQAKSQGNFDLIFHNQERNGCAATKKECLLAAFGGTPAQTVAFNFFNIGHKALNFRSSWRWDAEKRRIFAELGGPLLNNRKWHIRVGTDIRNENWAIRNSFSGTEPLLAALNLKRQTADVQFDDVISGRLQWSATTEFSNRTYRNVLPGALLTKELISSGPQLKQSLTLKSELLRLPEHRLIVDSTASIAVARLWSSDRNFAQLQGSVRLQWFPQHTGDKYEMEHLVRAGKTFGDPSFDQLFVLGVHGDTDLTMRGHISTRDGKKGTGPLGRNYFLSNWEFTRRISQVPFVKLRVGPFVDTGKITDPIPGFGSHEWLWDIGPEAKVEVRGFMVVLSYGRDLRSGRNALAADLR